MKLLAILLTVFFLQVKADGFSQGTVTYWGENVPLEKVISAIRQQTGYLFFYTEDIWNELKPVTLKVRNTPVLTVIEIILKDQPISFVIQEKTVILTRKKKQALEMQAAEVKRLSKINVNGKVINEKGDPIQQATVSVKESDIVTVTNTKGEFFLSGINDDAVLLITNVGFSPELVRVNGRNFIQVTLFTKIGNLEDVVVIGYGQVSKRFNTGNVTSVKAADIEKQPVNNPLLALAGRVPGLEISQSTGISGSAVNVKIRGQNSIYNGNYPLYIIDGVPYTSTNLPGLTPILGGSGVAPGSPFSYINPSDIESIEVLKDADATAIYGSRGANGVILITTKKGKAGSTKVNINAQAGFGKVARKLDLLDTKQYIEMRNEAFKNDGSAPSPNSDFDLTLWDSTQFTDWQEELIGGTASYNDLQASVSGGNANTQILVGTGYHKETTVFPGDFSDRKTSVHFNANNVSPDKKFKISLSGIYVIDNNRLSGNEFTEQSLRLPPNAPKMYNDDGSINWAPNAAGISTWPSPNPAARLLVGYITKTNNLVSNATVSYQLLPELEIKTSLGYTNMQTDEVITVPLTSFDPSVWNVTQRSSRFSDNNIQSWIIEPQISSAIKLFKGELKGLLGATIQKNVSDGEILWANGFNSDIVLEDIKSATTITVYSSLRSTYRYTAIFGRLNYNFADKYLLNFTARRDGTSRFGPAKRFHNFGAIGLGWIFTKETFFKVPFISFGKLRASYGTTGIDQVGDYAYMDLYSPVDVNVPYMGRTGIRPNRIYTPDLAWEETKKAEGGLELGFLEDKIFLSVSVYRNQSNNQLIDYPLPAITGFTSIKRNLNALVENKGVEVEVKTQNISTESFTWSSSFNISSNRNKLVRAPIEADFEFVRRKIGHPLTSTFVYKFLGVDPITGLYQFADMHGAPTPNPDPTTDRNYLVDFGTKFYGGVQNSFRYKSVVLDMNLQFVQGMQGSVYTYNYVPGYYGRNQPSTVLGRWQKAGDVSSIQRFSQDFSTIKSYANASESSQVFGNASYIRLRNVALSWVVPKRWTTKARLDIARLYIHGQNVFTVTNFQGLDPETRSSSSLPVLRVITFGMQLTF